MTPLVILSLSTLLQFIAAFFAINLIRITGKFTAWFLIALALFFMGLRRSITLFRSLVSDTGISVDLSAELVALLISALMLAGVVGIRKTFLQMAVVNNALREQDYQYRSLAALSPVGIYRTDKDGMCIYVNKRWTDITGLSEEEAMGDGWARALHEDDRPRVFSEWNEAVSSGSPFVSEYRFHRPDGTDVWVLGQSRVDLDANNTTVGYVGTITDISDRKQMEEQLRQSQKMEALGNLCGGIAHEFNNMLMAISGSLELIQESGGSKASLDKMIPIALEGTRRGKELTQQLLVYSRSRKLHPCLTDLHEPAANTIKMLEKTLIESIQLDYQADSELWPVMIDGGELESALINLAVNARDAMPEGGKLSIKLSNCKLADARKCKALDLQPGEYVLVMVSDSGSGIDPQNLSHIFDPFYTTKGVGEGTGLGLSMVQGFVQQSGGAIEVSSQPDKGTVFKLYFPASRDAAKHAGEYKSRGGEVLKGHEVVLYVEDDPQVLQVGTTMLTNLGYRVMKAENGPDALEVLKGDKGIDLLLTDIAMPGGMSGTELAQQALAIHPHLKVLLATGYKPENLHELKAGGREFPVIEKPFYFRELANKVRQILDASSSAVKESAASDSLFLD